VKHRKVAVVAAALLVRRCDGRSPAFAFVGRLGERAMRNLLLVLAVAGYVIALVPARLCHLDIGSFRRTLWVGYGSRDRWLRGIKLAYLAGGWPSLAVALAWRRSTTREGLVELRDQLREAQNEPERSDAPSPRSPTDARPRRRTERRAPGAGSARASATASVGRA